MSAALILVVIYGVSSICDNYRLGRALCSDTIRMDADIRDLVDIIDYTQNQFARSRTGMDGVNRDPFDGAIHSAKLLFGVSDPFREGVTTKWYQQIAKIFYRTQMSHDKGFENTFRKGDIDIFQDKLVDLSNMLIGFYTYYNQIPEWKRYLISWKDAQDRLSDQAITILEGPPVLNAQKFDRTKFVLYSISAYRPAAWPETGNHSLKGRGAWRFDFPPAARYTYLFS